MAIVINFGADLSVIKLKTSKSQVVAEDYDVYEYGGGSALEDVETIKDLLDKIIKEHPEVMVEPVYISLSLGSGIQYKTFDVTLDNFEEKRKISSREREIKVFEVCQKFLPNCLEGHYEVAIVTEHQTDIDAVICCAYVPLKSLENIKAAFEEKEITYLDIKPLLYGFVKVLDLASNGQMIIETKKAVVIVNEFGCISWAKPEGNAFSKILIKNYLEKEVASLYPVNVETVRTEDVQLSKLMHYVLPGIANTTTIDNEEIYAACGFFAENFKGKPMPSKVVPNSDVEEAEIVVDERREKDGFASKIRNLFKKTGTK